MADQPNPSKCGAGKRLGILGGGQLGRMLALAARPLGVHTIVVDPMPNCPAAVVADEHIVGSFTDAAVIASLAAVCDAVTIEIEHINTAGLASLSGTVVIEPRADTISVIQDKLEQKRCMKAAGVPLGEFSAVESVEELRALIEVYGLPLMLKSRKLAYDGRGNAAVRSPEDVDAAWQSLAPKGGLYAEKWVPFRRELAVLVVRDASGNSRTYPAVQTVQQDSICHLVIAPAPVPGDVLRRAQEVAERAIGALHGAGVFAVELFELEDGSVLLNEIAPRVHNSGHYTIEACEVSQFENHVRAVLGLPLGSPRMRVPAAAMLNILGSADGQAGYEDAMALVGRALRTAGASVHWYDKAKVVRGRKMGHITITGESPMEVSQRVASVLGEGSAASPSTLATLGALHGYAPLVGIIMGSDSDLPTMAAAAKTLQDFGVPFELTIVSAHRTPRRLLEYASGARARGLRVIIAAAGGAAHLPGMVAALTSLPVIGVPIPLTYLDGVDSLYSIVQMPRGVPVATVAVGNSTNGALLAVRILGSTISHLGDAMEAYQANMEREVMGKVDKLERVGWEGYLSSEQHKQK